ncbi:hypothetical protein G9C85_18455 [Halorubellus sp. JP-L1]|uniref:hypothetical protein n=1 Tax=Halorubellus sp. JP-L1 TaxID=2715753 RepID=UPI00140CF196|nr:hypothetical protein [Halorubellus sp. JP-L1]NHN43605.1 hypothetical protein [Halorubellus sp. JP-L1]
MAPSTRRRLLQATAGTTALALGGCVASLNVPRARKTYVSTTPRDPVIDGYDASANEMPFATALVTSSAMASRTLDIDALPEAQVDDWQNVDYDHNTVSAFVSTHQFHEPESYHVVDVTSSLEGGTVAYEITIDDWPEPLVENARQYYYTRLAKWDEPVDGDDANATVTIDYDRV